MDNGAHAVVHAQFGDESGHVRLDGRLAQTQAMGDLLVGQGVHHEGEDLVLARGERDAGRQGVRRGLVRRYPDRLQQARRGILVICLTSADDSGGGG